MIHQVVLDKPPRKSEWDMYIGEVEFVVPVGVKVTKKDLLLQFDFAGQMSLALNSKHKGTIKAVHVKVGQEITSGTLLMEIDDGLNP